MRVHTFAFGVGTGALAAAAYVVAEVARAAATNGVPRSAAVRELVDWRALWLTIALVCGAGAFAAVLPRPADATVRAAHEAADGAATTHGAPLVLLATTVCAAAAVDAFAAYGAAYVLTPAILVPIEIASRRGLVVYDVTSAAFLTTRAAAYGTLRVACTLSARAGLAPGVARLLPFAVSSLETLGMLCAGRFEAYYTFDARSRTFAAYALLKAGVFLALPLAEEGLAAHARRG